MMKGQEVSSIISLVPLMATMLTQCTGKDIGVHYETVRFTDSVISFALLSCLG